MLNKHKLFLLCAKWIPVVTAIGILDGKDKLFIRCSKESITKCYF